METIYGHEFLGGARYEKFAIRGLPSGRCGKTFSKEFGASQNILRKWAEKDAHPIIATQGLWRGGAHDYSGNSTLTEGLKELEKFAKIAADHPNQCFQFSIFCEHRLKTAQLSKAFTEQWKIVKNIHNIALVNTPMSGGDLLKSEAFGIPVDRLLNEIHGTWNPNVKGFAPYMWAGDGLPAQDCNIQLYKDRHANAVILWLWMQQYNCKLKPDDTTPIAQRKVKPVNKQVISLEYLIPFKGSTKFDRGSLFKSHADQHYPKPNPREQKPVIITSVNAEKLEFMDNQTIVHTAKRAGNYTDGRALYRASIWGFEIQKRSTNKIVKVVAVSGKKRTILGTVNPAFRENAWRDKALLKVLYKYTRKVTAEDLEMFDADQLIDMDWI